MGREFGPSPEDIDPEVSSESDAHSKHELGTLPEQAVNKPFEKAPSETKLSQVFNFINQGVHNPNFQTEFRPEENWQERTRILSDSEFDKSVIGHNKSNLHPFILEAEGKDLNRRSKEYSMVIDARVDIQTGEVLIRRSYLDRAEPDSVLFVLCHELGHSISENIHEEYDGYSDPKVPNLVDEIRKSGYTVETKDLTVYRRGLLEQLMLEGKQIHQLSNKPEIYGEFFDEMYADIYRLYLMANIYSSEFKLNFKAAVARIAKNLKAQPLNDKFAYLNAVLGYAKEVGWEPLIRAGRNSDLKGFIAAGNDYLGEERNIRALRKISDLKEKNAQSTKTSRGLL